MLMEDNSGKLKEFNRLNRGFESLYHGISRKMGLSDSAFIILYNLWDLGEGCLQKDICDAAGISKQTIHSAMRKLEQEGYLYLKPGKGRQMRLFLTEEGRELIRQKIVPVAALEAEAFGALTEEECGQLLRTTAKYLECFKEKVKEL